VRLYFVLVLVLGPPVLVGLLVLVLGLYVLILALVLAPLVLVLVLDDIVLATRLLINNNTIKNLCKQKDRQSLV